MAAPAVGTYPPELDTIILEVRENKDPFALALEARGMDPLANGRDDCARMLRRLRKCIDGHGKSQTKSCHQHCCQYCAYKRMEGLMEQYYEFIQVMRAQKTAIAMITARIAGDWQDTPQARYDVRSLREHVSDALSSFESKYGCPVFQITFIDNAHNGRLTIRALVWSPNRHLEASEIRERFKAVGIDVSLDIRYSQARDAEECFQKTFGRWKPPTDPRENAVLEYLLQGTHQIQVRGKEVVRELFPCSTNPDMGNNSGDPEEESVAATSNPTTKHGHAPGTCPECGKPFVKFSNWCAPGEKPSQWFDRNGAPTSPPD